MKIRLSWLPWSATFQRVVQEKNTRYTYLSLLLIITVIVLGPANPALPLIYSIPQTQIFGLRGPELGETEAAPPRLSVPRVFPFLETQVSKVGLQIYQEALTSALAHDFVTR